MRVLVIYASDLAASSQVAPGGITGNVRSYLSRLPAEWNVEVWGVDDRLGDGRTREMELSGRAITFRPLMRAEAVASRKLPLSPRFCAALAAAAWKHRLDGTHWDLLVTHRTEYHATLALTRPARLLPPSVAMIHGSSAWSYSAMGRLRGFGQRLGEQLAIGHASAIALVAGSTLPYYRRRYPDQAERFVWIPNGVDVGRFTTADGRSWRHRHGFDDLDRIIVYHGRYGREKGIGRMIDAFRLLMRQHERWHLVCAGSGPAGEELRAAATTWGRGRIHDLGYVPPAELPPVLAAADVSLLLSDFEGLSNSLLEALAAGVPVVATDAGDNRIILERVGRSLIVQPDPSAVALAVVSAWERHNALRVKAKAVANQFSLQARVRRLIDLFSSVAARSELLPEQYAV